MVAFIYLHRHPKSVLLGKYCKQLVALPEINGIGGKEEKGEEEVLLNSLSCQFHSQWQAFKRLF